MAEESKLAKEIEEAAAALDARSMATDFLGRLRATESADGPSRIQLLTDLADSGLPALLQRLGIEASPMEDLQPVADLIRALSVVRPDLDPAELDRLWQLAVSTLTVVASFSTPAASPRASRAFWKR